MLRWIVLAMVYQGSLLATVHVIGDSHSKASFCRSDLPQIKSEKIYRGVWKYAVDGRAISIPFQIHHIGPRTMYHIGKWGLWNRSHYVLNRRPFPVLEEECKFEDGDTVVFVFGELDVRAHIFKQTVLQGRSCTDLIDELVDHYLAAVAVTASLGKELNLIVASVLPPYPVDNPRLPRVYGTNLERRKAARYLNLRLEEKCAQVGLTFLDGYREYTLEDGSLKKSVADSGQVHLKTTTNRSVKEALFALLDLTRYDES